MCSPVRISPLMSGVSLASATWGNRLWASGVGKDYIRSACKVDGLLASDIYCCFNCEDANNSN